MSSPLAIYVHWGNSNYLKYSINQVKFFNPNTPIYLLGDSNNNHLKNVFHFDIHNYSKLADTFEKVYVHYNTIPKYYTLFWFKRWFIMKEFFQEIGYLGPFICFDSDTLSYFNIPNEFKKFSNYNITINGERAPHCTFFKEVSVLNEFCDFILMFYSQKHGQDKLKQMDLDYKRKNQPGGIDDMTFLYLFTQRYPSITGNSALIINNETYDGNINCQENFEFDVNKKIKKIYWINHLPYGKLLDNNNLIKFNILHFQGPAKHYMHIYYSGNGMHLAKIWTSIYYFLEKIKTIIYKKLHFF